MTSVKNRKLRKQFAQAHQNETTADWKNVWWVWVSAATSSTNVAKTTGKPGSVLPRVSVSGCWWWRCNGGVMVGCILTIGCLSSDECFQQGTRFKWSQTSFSSMRISLVYRMAPEGSRHQSSRARCTVATAWCYDVRTDSEEHFQHFVESMQQKEGKWS